MEFQPDLNQGWQHSAEKGMKNDDNITNRKHAGCLVDLDSSARCLQSSATRGCQSVESAVGEHTSRDHASFHEGFQPQIGLPVEYRDHSSHALAQ
jgi:hypothetical protein